MSYHAKSIAQVMAELQTGDRGLTLDEAQKRRVASGPNTLPKSHTQAKRLHIFFSQWKSPLIVLLVIAGFVSGAVGDPIDMYIILATAAINACIGFIQEDKANQALQKLRTLVQYRATVIRDGKKQSISSDDVVPGDILFLDAGDRVQADGRLLSTNSLWVNESALTGESLPVEKGTHALAVNIPLGDRINMVHRGTTVVNGQGSVIVTATGSATELGKIAQMVEETKESETPLQRELGHIEKRIGVLVIVLALFLLGVGVVLGRGEYRFIELFTTAVAVSVAAIPEGLVISLTIILAIGMQQILKRKALVRKMVAAETLGSVSVICTDKTGTLTEGRMRVHTVVTKSRNISFHDLPSLQQDNAFGDAAFALRIAVLCNDATLQNPESPEEVWSFIGDTTDSALIAAGMRANIQKHIFDTAIPRLASIPFTSEEKWMATLHRVDHETNVYVKGACEVLSPRIVAVEQKGKAVPITDLDRQWLETTEAELTSTGLRVIALTYKICPMEKTTLTTDDIQDLVFVGFIALSDPLRTDVHETIKKAQRAGIRVMMITGDHKRTAQAIGKELGLPSEDQDVLDGRALDAMSDEELSRVVEHASLFVRVDPKHKIRIVQALQAKGETVAMTGDGVNDAPALKAADIGIALGSGTDVAKETSDMVLLNDSFSTIVAAVEEGRRMYQNIKKVLLYLLAGSFAEVILIAGSILAGLPLPVLPAQILWMNIIIESFSGTALAFDAGDPENMNDAPRLRSERLVDRNMMWLLAIITIVSNIFRFGLVWYYGTILHDIPLMRTVAFVGLGIDALMYIYSVRSMRRHVWKTNPFSNSYLTLSLLVSWLLLFVAVYVPGLQTILHTVPLGAKEWLLLILFGFSNMLLIEMMKSLLFHRKNISPV